MVARWAPWLAIGTGVATLAALVGAVSVGSERVERSSAYCASCHEEHAGDEHLPGHGETACQDCHPAPEGDRLRFVWAMVDPGVALPEHGAVDRDSCVGCHSTDQVEWAVLLRNEGHASHANGPEALECVQCHAGSLHGRPTDEESCLGCHEAVPLESEPRAEADCITCHSFGERSADGDRWTPAGEGESWAGRIAVTQVHGAADCRLCHNPHEPADRPTPDCTSCHRGNIAATAAAGPEQHGGSVCTSCHQVHGDREALPRLCAGCHAGPNMAVVAGATLPGAAAGAGQDARAGSHGPSAGIPLVAAAPLTTAELEERTHEGRCPTCHQPHAFVADAQVCQGCHDHQEQVTSLRALPEGVHDRCVGCHDPHAPPPGREACLECHRKPTGAGVPGQHRDCLSCHQPHSERPTFAEACSAACHEGPRRSVRSGPAPHRNCGSCHTAHGDPDQGSAQACRSCHQQQAASLRRGRHQNCTSCHTPHKFERAAANARCATCHAEATAPTATHRGECASCHSIHGGQSRADNCASCHGDVRLDVARHSCDGCHQPHRPAATAASQCATCHAAVVRTSRTWPSNTPHAGQCMDCHQTHNVQRKEDCRSCHQQQATRAHVGAHDGCQGCHAPHRPAPGFTAGWWNGCASCHREQGRQAASASRAEHRTCQSCHDRPERRAPTCQSCHQMERVGLHAVAEHRDCRTCHATHGTPEPRPAQCRSCHDDRPDHMPEARQCQSCHIFGRQ